MNQKENKIINEKYQEWNGIDNQDWLVCQDNFFDL